MLICENVLNYHSSEDDYYQEWFDDVEDGWVALINCREHVLREMESARNDYYLAMGGTFDNVSWRSLVPSKVFDRVNMIMNKRLTA